MDDSHENFFHRRVRYVQPEDQTCSNFPDCKTQTQDALEAPIIKEETRRKLTVEWGQGHIEKLSKKSIWELRKSGLPDCSRKCCQWAALTSLFCVISRRGNDFRVTKGNFQKPVQFFNSFFLELTRIFQQISGSLLHSSWFLELSRNFFSKFSAVICTVVFFGINQNFSANFRQFFAQ